MKILKEKIPPLVFTPWWIGKKIICENCKSEMIVEETDFPWVANLGKMVHFPCPIKGCGNANALHRE